MNLTTDAEISLDPTLQIRHACKRKGPHEASLFLCLNHTGFLPRAAKPLVGEMSA
jgi:hypothetical protein